MDYSKIKNLTPSIISHAMKYGNTFSKYNYLKKSPAWKMFLLKKVSNGSKSRQFYEDLSEIIKMQEKVNQEWNKQYNRFLCDTANRL